MAWCRMPSLLAALEMSPDMSASNCIRECPMPFDTLFESSRFGCHLQLVPALVAVVRVPFPFIRGVAKHGAFNLGILKYMQGKKSNVESLVVYDYLAAADSITYLWQYLIERRRIGNHRRRNAMD